jgi:hypothetical protein
MGWSAGYVTEVDYSYGYDREQYPRLFEYQIRDGKVLETEEQNIAGLRARASQFASRRAPLLFSLRAG